jgi:hypothetical protein
MSPLPGQDETFEDLFTVGGVRAAGEAAQVATQVGERAFGQVCGFQPVPPAQRLTQVGQHAVEFNLGLLDHLGCPEAPAAVIAST